MIENWILELCYRVSFVLVFVMILIALYCVKKGLFENGLGVEKRTRLFSLAALLILVSEFFVEYAYLYVKQWFTFFGN